MKQIIDVGLPPLKQPFSWAVKASGQMLFTAHGPVRPDGSIDTGPIEQQARLTFTNLRNALQAAGGTLAHVTQVLIYMTDVATCRPSTPCTASSSRRPIPTAPAWGFRRWWCRA